MIKMSKIYQRLSKKQQKQSKRRSEGHRHHRWTYGQDMAGIGPDHRTTDSLFIAFYFVFSRLLFICLLNTTVLVKSPSILPVVAVMQGWVVGFSDVGMHAEFTVDHGGQNVVITSLARLLFLHFEEFTHLPINNTEITQS